MTLKIKIYSYISLLILPIILSFSAMADTNSIVRTDNQQIKQGIQQEIQETVHSGAKINENVIKDKHLETLLNLKSLINNFQEREAEIKSLSKKMNNLKGEEAKEISEEIDELKNKKK